MPKTFQLPSRLRNLVTVLFITAFFYPLINLLRGWPYKYLSFSVHAQEFIFFALALYALVQLQYFIHLRIIAAAAFRGHITRQVIVELLLSCIYTPVVCFLSYMIVYAPNFRLGIDPRGPILFTIILFLVQLIYLFYQWFSDYLIRFRRSVMREEKLLYENMMVQYKALQYHLRPHFLFNFLNGLNGAITENPSKATQIVAHMADCLRHVLMAPEHPTIRLDDEMHFLDRYYRLLEMRFPGSIILVDRIDEEDKRRQVPPCLLQLLMENAVRYNEISPAQPVTISISSLPPNKLEVSSTITKRIKIDPLSRTAIGLENIKNRYALLTDEEISITQTQDEFTVILPLLEKPAI